MVLEFCANLCDVKGHVDHECELFLKSQGVEQILCVLIIRRLW